MPRKAKPSDTTESDAPPAAVESAASPAAGLKYLIGDKLQLTVREPVSRKDARADTPGNYIPQQFIGEVEAVNLEVEVPSIRVRWHLPASYGYDTHEGTLSTLIHICNGVWLETRKGARNIVVTIETIAEDVYQRLLEEAAAN